MVSLTTQLVTIWTKLSLVQKNRMIYWSSTCKHFPFFSCFDGFSGAYCEPVVKSLYLLLISATDMQTACRTPAAQNSRNALLEQTVFEDIQKQQSARVSLCVSGIWDLSVAAPSVAFHASWPESEMHLFKSKCCSLCCSNAVVQQHEGSLWVGWPVRIHSRNRIPDQTHPSKLQSDEHSLVNGAQ